MQNIHYKTDVQFMIQKPGFNTVPQLCCINETVAMTYPYKLDDNIEENSNSLVSFPKIKVDLYVNKL